MTFGYDDISSKADMLLPRRPHIAFLHPSSAYSGGRDVVNFLSLIMNPRMAMNYHLFCLCEGKRHVQAAVIKARSAKLPNRLRYYYHIFENSIKLSLKQQP